MSAPRRFDAALIVAGATLWMAAHPYAGIYQDANLYLLMALNWLAPEAYARDPWFLFGSQDSYTLFSPLYGGLIDLAGIADGARVLVAMGGFLWLAASWFAAKRLFSEPLPRSVAFLCCAVFSLNISPAGSTFVLNESFATARVLAIPLAIAALVFDVRQRPFVPWLLAACSVVLHPLFGIWAVFCLVATRLSERWLAAAVIAGLLLPLLTLLHPAASALQALSPERLTFLQETTRDLLVLGNDWRQLNSLLFWLAALLIGGGWGAEGFRRTYRVLALLAGAGYLLSALVSNYLPMTILVQAQPWRAVWLAAYFSVFALIDVAWRTGRADAEGWYRVALIAAILILCRPFAGVLLMAAWVAFSAAPRLINRLSSSAGLLRVLAIIATLFALPGFIADVRLEGEALTHLGWTVEHTLRGIVGGGGFGVGPVLLSCLLLALLSRPLLAFPMLLASLAWVAGHWDTRDLAASRWEGAFQAGRLAAFSGFHRGQTVYWPGRAQDVWFGVGTAAYVGEYHLSGLVFSEQRVLLVGQRWKRAAVASVTEAAPLSMAEEVRVLAEFRRRHPERHYGRDHPGDYVTKALTPAGVVYLCADPALDWVLAHWPEVSGQSGLPVDKRVSGGSNLYAYSCTDFRSRYAESSL
ncbi:hypothetical protein [Azospira restricta]|uniref:Uncharacterized protein n=1 Tax=Azospira restricta TaxID=404405 RepID=A0A974SNC4_9RHOO|nr:hypothetical protein [Azospira restricta]QRJ63610.1 hypothetical protein IWH25_18025 [Azospira restricta]